MGRNSGVQYCDDSLSLTAGCSGCELFNPKASPEESRCYAERLTRRYAGGKGWVKSFTSPKLFLHRMNAAEKWKDLTGATRPDKPWLDGMPRIIFCDDMGELFDPRLPNPDEWLPDIIMRMADTPHIYLLLTKQARRMAAYFDTHQCPVNVWPGVSVTDEKRLPRVSQLLDIKAKYRWISYEPAWGWVDFTRVLGTDGQLHNALDNIQWLVNGGESKQGKIEPKPFDIRWAQRLLGPCAEAGCKLFIKQLGSLPYCSPEHDGATGYDLSLKDSHGGDWEEWPQELRVRELPS